MNGRLVWFWSMFGALGKQAARGQDGTLADQLPLLSGVVALAAQHVNIPAPSSEETTPVRRLRELAEHMSDLGRSLRGAGLHVPDTTHAFAWLDLAESLREEGWSSAE